jgi:oxygen-independent coproporphyrinogen-3 oxidase
MLALRTAEGVDLASFRERYGLDVAQHYRAQIDELAGGGFLTVADGRVRLTERGRFVANDVCAAFLAD